MTAELLIKGFLALIFSGLFAWMVYRDSDSGMDSRRRRYLPYISGMLLPLCVLTILICELVFSDTESGMRITLAFCFGVFLHICLLLYPVSSKRIE